MLYDAQLDLLGIFLTRRDEIVERLQALLNAQRKPLEYQQDRPLLFSHIEDCFFTPGLTYDQLRLRGQLDEAQRASGFRPRDLPGLHNDLVDPAELTVRAFHMWRRTRWPGRNGRVRYAHTLFNLSIVRTLVLLSLRLWDGDPSSAGDRLAALQAMLDRLWGGTPADQPVFVRDGRWLIPLAQSPATDALAPYFEVAARVAETLPHADRLEIHRAGVCMAAGHLRSQQHYYATKKSVPLHEETLVSNLRNTNALDLALLIQDLVPLLEAYEDACHDDDERRRLALADAICQGISADPDLFVNRLELLQAYSMIEHLFITTGPDGGAVYTPMGQRHVQLFRDYQARLARVVESLCEDCRRFRPVEGAYSPSGVLYGFSSDLVEHMALKAAHEDASPRFSLEDVFVSTEAGTEASTGKLAWVNGWRRLPHVPPDVRKQFEYPQRFAETVFDRLEQALRARASDDGTNSVPTGRLFVAPADDSLAGRDASVIPHLPVQYIGSSDAQLVSEGKAEHHGERLLSSDRQEGRCLLSYRTPAGWVAIRKTALTEVLGAGRDVRLVGLPRATAGALKLMCPDLVVLPEDSAHVPGYAASR